MKSTIKKQIKSYVSMGVAFFTVTSSLMIPVTSFANEQESTIQKKVESKHKKRENSEQAPYRNVMYYGDWSVWGGQGNQFPKDLPADAYTHLNFAFLDFDANGDLVLTDKDAAFGHPVGSNNTWGDVLSGGIPALIALRKQHPNMKLGISLGGWSKSGDFSTVAADPAKRANLIKNVLKFVQYTGMDFVDVDWEFPGIVRQGDLVDNTQDEGTPNASAADGANYLTLMQKFRKALDKQGEEEGKKYELSVALPGTKKQLEDGGVDLEKLFQVLDFGNMMTYDMNGAWTDKSGHHTALYTNPKDPNGGYSADAIVKYLKSKNVPMNKVAIGAAFYTRGWDDVDKGSDKKHPGLFQNAAIAGKDADQTPSRGAENEAPLKLGSGGRRGGVWSYRNLDKLKAKDPSLKEYWDETAKAPYLYSEKTKNLFTFDNKKSVQEKAKYVKEKRLGGMISWQSSQDKDNNGNNVRDELTKTMAKELYGDAKLPHVTEDGKNKKLKIDLKLEAVKTDSGKAGYGFTIKNNEVLENYTSEALKLADEFYSTIKKAKLIITMKDGSTLEKGDYKAGTVTAKNGQTIVDLSSVYDAKFIKPGSSYAFKLATNKKVDLKNVQKIVLQQFYNDKTMLSSQTIYGEEGDQPAKQAPVILGATDQTIKLNDSFDPMAGVTAKDNEDGDLTAKIKVAGKVDTKKVGSYELTYSVKNSKGLEAKVVRKINVVEAEPTTDKDKLNDSAAEMVNPVNQVMVGYWHNWASKNDGYKQGTALAMPFDKVDPAYNVVNVSFMKATASNRIPTFKPYNQSDEEFRKQVGNLNAQGRSVLISLGGADAHIELTSKDKDALVAEIIKLTDKYGFDGLDIDLEQSAITAAENQTVIPQALKEVKAHYAKQGKNFLITMAPEFPYLKANGSYAKYIDALEGHYDWINPQYYNQGGDGVSGENGQWLAQNNDAKKEDFLFYLTSALINGTDGYANYVKIPADKLVIGLPANEDAAGSGYVRDPLVLSKVMECLTASGNKIKGLMTWSVNWDNGLDANGRPYNWGFANNYKQLIDYDNEEKEEKKPVISDKEKEEKKPIISGVKDVELTVGDNFDPLAGITATDGEGNDVTNAIKVSGIVDINKPGTYTITYHVKSISGNAEASATRVVTVVEKNTPGHNEWDAGKVYTGGEIVTYKGKQYKAKWWTQGDQPDQSGPYGPWEALASATRVVTVDEQNPLGHAKWDAGKVYTGAQIVTYKGKQYKAKWWTQGDQPDQSGPYGPWEEVK